MTTWDIDAVSKEWLKDYVRQMEDENGIFAGLKEGNRVIKLSEGMVVKYGSGVTAEEAATQEFAYRHVDSSIVRVPRVYRFFKDESRQPFAWGYLFMEYFDGWVLDDLDLGIHTDIIPRLANIVAHFGSISSQIPGPVGGGKARGPIWAFEGARMVFHSIHDLNEWLNKRLAYHGEITSHSQSIDITSMKLVLCHMDLSRRNMIMLPDRSLCLLDFGSAGLYPRYFEVASLQHLNPDDTEYTGPLEQTLRQILALTEEEEEQMNLLHRIIAVHARFPCAFGGSDPSNMHTWTVSEYDSASHSPPELELSTEVQSPPAPLSFDIAAFSHSPQTPPSPPPPPPAYPLTYHRPHTSLPQPPPPQA